MTYLQFLAGHRLTVHIIEETPEFLFARVVNGEWNAGFHKESGTLFIGSRPTDMTEESIRTIGDVILHRLEVPEDITDYNKAAVWAQGQIEGGDR